MYKTDAHDGQATSASVFNYINKASYENTPAEKDVGALTQIFQESQPINAPLIPFKAESDVSLLQNATFIDPREEMIESLDDHSQLFLTEVAKAAQIFEENKIENEKTIASQAKSIEELNALLIQAEARNKELTLLLEAQSRAHKEDKEQRTKILTSEIKSVFELAQSIKSCQKNIPICHEYASFKMMASKYSHGTIAGGDYIGHTFAQALPIILSKIDIEYKERAHLPMNTFTEETILNMTFIEERLTTISKT